MHLSKERIYNFKNSLYFHLITILKRFHSLDCGKSNECVENGNFAYIFQQNIFCWNLMHSVESPSNKSDGN